MKFSIKSIKKVQLDILKYLLMEYLPQKRGAGLKSTKKVIAIKIFHYKLKRRILSSSRC